MGADMIGYILMGPEKISDEAIRRAANKIMKIKDKPLCALCGEPVIAGEGCNDCGQLSEDYSRIQSIEEAFNRVEDIIKSWPPNFRDCCMRADPLRSDYVIVFAGEMSWGDAPEGSGFLTLERIAMSRIMEELGIL